jgi:CRISPR/Cas system-associated exonuclease Cas4 (RecB family)
MACDDMPLVGTRVSIQELYTRYIKEYLFCSMKLYLGSRGGNKSQLGGHKRINCYSVNCTHIERIHLEIRGHAERRKIRGRGIFVY